MASKVFQCIYCGRADFKSNAGLVMHQQRTKACYLKMAKSLKISPTAPMMKAGNLPKLGLPGHELRKLLSDEVNAAANKLLDAMEQKTQHLDDNTRKRAFTTASMDIEEDGSEQSQTFAYEGEEDAEEETNSLPLSIDEAAIDAQEEAANEEDAVVTNNKSLNEIWKTFVDKAKNFPTFRDDERHAINLLLLLRTSKAPLLMYEQVMKWHFVANGDIHHSQTVGQSFHYISREKLFKTLRQRYQLTKGLNNTTQIMLPHAKAKATVVWNDAKEQMISLLTDPRITDDDYLFFDDNPLAPPPRNISVIGDLNTGRSYIKTYRKLITDPNKQILLPVIFYIDAANTGQFADLPITALKFSLGIFNRKARDKDYCWRILGYIPAITKHKAQGFKMLQKSMHQDGVISSEFLSEGEESDQDEVVHKAQDFHSMLKIVLKSYISLQESGFVWNF